MKFTKNDLKLWKRKENENIFTFMTFQELLDTANKTHETPIKISYKSEKFKKELLNKLKNDEIDDIEKIKIKSLYYLLSGKERVFGEHYDITFERLITNIDTDKVVELAIAMSEVFEMLDVPNC